MKTTFSLAVLCGTLLAVSVAWIMLPLEQNLVAEDGAKTASEVEKDIFGEPPGAKRLDPKVPIWVDVKNRLVIVDGEVTLREGQLEMFACLKGTKEHESVVGVHGKAYYIHAGLLAIGAKVGGPVQFDPKYVPASGTEIEVIVLWMDKDGKKHQVPAQQWVRNVETKKPMSHPWVFAGSGFWFDDMTGREHYQAEGGDLICVSNFPSATLDLPVESTQANMGLLFEANTAEIPPLRTKVRLVLRPKFKPGELEEEKKTEKAAEQPPADQPEPESKSAPQKKSE